MDGVFVTVVAMDAATAVDDAAGTFSPLKPEPSEGGNTRTNVDGNIPFFAVPSTYPVNHPFFSRVTMMRSSFLKLSSPRSLVSQSCSAMATRSVGCLTNADCAAVAAATMPGVAAEAVVVVVVAAVLVGALVWLMLVVAGAATTTGGVCVVVSAGVEAVAGVVAVVIVLVVPLAVADVAVGSMTASGCNSG